MSFIDHGRGAYVAVHLLLLGLLALPRPATESDWARVQEWFVGWSHTAASLGIQVSAQQVEAVFRWFNGGFGAAHEMASVVTEPVDLYLGLDQHWSMFSSVPSRSAKLEILMLEQGGWRVLYRARSDKHDWRRSQLDHERFRTYINDFAWRRDHREYKRFAMWISEQVHAEFPDIRRVRVQMREVALLPPGELRAAGKLPRGDVYWTEDSP